MVNLLGTLSGDYVLYFFGNARGDLLEFFPYRLIDRGGVGRACRRRRCLGLLVFEALHEYGRRFGDRIVPGCESAAVDRREDIAFQVLGLMDKFPLKNRDIAI
jgi:hypothetical protein